MSSGQRLVYGQLTDDELVFIREFEAVDLAQLRCAIGAANSWGELKASISPRRWLEAVSPFVEDDEPLPADDEPFASRNLPRYEAGDWPEWPAHRMLDWMPEDIRKRFGEIGSSMVNDDSLVIDPASERQVVAALKEAGYTCIRDDHLVEMASGY